MMKNLILVLLSCLCLSLSYCFGAGNALCTNNAARSWWDVRHYLIHLDIDTANGFLSGYVNMTAAVNGRIGDSLQIDLKEPLTILSIVSCSGREEKQVPFLKDGEAYYLTGDLGPLVSNGLIKLRIRYKGIPQVAARPPWDGGIVLDRDAGGTRWMAVACQGVGASVWFPCKDYQGDEADEGMQLTMTVPYGLSMIGNGACLVENRRSDPGKAYWIWNVSNPINNYDITFYIGDYVHWSDTLDGAKGRLNLDYYVLRRNLDRARKQFEVVKPMLHCFEEKMGPYPFYEDGYKLVDAPYLGMEHQSAVAYGNGYMMGYKGQDRSNTGEGLKFDFIIVHESGHEWFGNSITTSDKADTWVHEGFTSYSETIFAECLLGKESAFRYQRGKKRTIHNDKPVQGTFGNCDEGSGDHYDKAAFMIHMIRMVMDDDRKFFNMLKAMNARFYHKIVRGQDIEQFINGYSGRNFDPVFRQYLNRAGLPRLEIVQKKNSFCFRWTQCVPGFDMPVIVTADGRKFWIYPETEWRTMKGEYKSIKVSGNFLVE